MQTVRRAARALALGLYALALAAPADAADGIASQGSRPSTALTVDETTGAAEAIARVGTEGFRSDEPEAPAGASVRVLRAEIERLRLENEALRTDVRSTDRLVGAGLLVGGMLLGALLRAAAGRRPQPRIRF